MSITNDDISRSDGTTDDSVSANGVARDDFASDDAAIGFLDTPVGRLSVAVTSVGVAAVGWGEPSALSRYLHVAFTKDAERVAPVLGQLEEYFGATRTKFDVPLDWRATNPTQRAILKNLFESVAAGESITYGELADRSGTGVPARGIGSIMGSNPIPIIVPCHRVVASDGLGGYSGGTRRNALDVKRWLLMFEGALPPTLDWNPAVGVPA
ncbi:MAG TPA: methylated-DNA--[protein]-cysteine S-methyltransferase [Jatrophihabitans sp.]